ncbi:hypothetical protein MBLNU13_g11536t1 [Cladosporium sp. NU13]
MQLIQRITVQLEDDHDDTFSILLTCKLLEAATFDRFADRFLKSREYCIVATNGKDKHITFMSSVFANRNIEQLSLALNQNETDLEDVQLDVMFTHAQSEVETVQEQSLLDAELLRCVFVAFKEKCPGVQLNIFLSTGNSINFLTADLDYLALQDPGALVLPGLSECMSSLRMLHFAKARSSSTEADRPESEGQPSTKDRHSLLRSTLSSANALRGLNLDFRNSHMDLQSSLQLTSVLLVAGSQPKLKYLCLQSLATTQGICPRPSANGAGN